MRIRNVLMAAVLMAGCGKSETTKPVTGSGAEPAKPAEKPRKDPDALPVTSADLLKELQGKFAESTWLKEGALEISKFDPSDIHVTYRRTSDKAPGFDSSKVFTMELVKSTIDVLLARGYNPKEHWTMIHGYFEWPGPKSPTGAATRRTYGDAVYDYSKDRIRFDPVD